MRAEAPRHPGHHAAIRAACESLRRSLTEASPALVLLNHRAAAVDELFEHVQAEVVSTGCDLRRTGVGACVEPGGRTIVRGHRRRPRQRI